MTFYDIPTYCETVVHSGFLNLGSNGAFFVVALLAWRMVKQASQQTRMVKLLVVLFAGIGLGSAYFHASPNHFSILFDAIPIYLFLSLSLFTLYFHITDDIKKSTLVAGGVITYILLTFIVLPDDFLFGSARHIGVLLFACGTLAVTRKKFPKESKYLTIALGIYALAIVARSIDERICSDFSYGTHFLWHILNAFAGYTLLLSLVRIEDKKNTLR